MEDTTSRIIPPKLKDAIIAIVFLRSRLKFAIPIETGLSLIFFFRLRMSFCTGVKRTASMGEIPAAIFTGLRMEIDTMIQPLMSVRETITA